MHALIGQSAVGYFVLINPRKNHASSELLHKSNRPQVSMGYRLIHNLGCWYQHPARMVYQLLYHNQINARALIGQSAVGYCYYKPTEKSHVF